MDTRDGLVAMPWRPDVFQRMMLAIAAIAGLAHLVFIGLMLWAGVTLLAWVNVGSVALYAWTFWLVKRHRPDPALFFMGVEILGHALLAAFVIGWDTGFHYYMVLTIPVLMLSTMWTLRVKTLLAVMIGALLIAADVYLRGRAPVVAVPQALEAFLYYFNLVATLAILGFLAFFYQRLVLMAEHQLRLQACTDPLTQLRNRRFAMEVAQHEAAVFERGGRPLALLLCDIDHFKRINDQHGHDAGDAVLRAVAQALREGVREIDHVARWGGEEFLVLLPGTEVAEAEQVADRLREAVQRLEAGPRAGALAVTMTFGVSVLRPGEGVEQALARADQALYRGKEAGRNRVILASAA
ncbi:diguanylate cyclase [Aquabacterium fontiphilum]|uniref:GGDEF domain-containing protein n=1 Tax=Aquabacterium fontiphilum TaxID=450365 RepID=UPI0013770549|nr:diguanylate cyclase [Aquabacterium fontiphilum]